MKEWSILNNERSFVQQRIIVSKNDSQQLDFLKDSIPSVIRKRRPKA